MTHIHYFDVNREHVEDSIRSLEETISTCVDGLHSMYRYKVQRSGKFRDGEVAAVVEISAVVQNHVIYSAVHYFIGVESGV